MKNRHIWGWKVSKEYKNQRSKQLTLAELWFSWNQLHVLCVTLKAIAPLSFILNLKTSFSSEEIITLHIIKKKQKRNKLIKCYLKKERPGWWLSGWVPAWESKGCWFDSQSGHMPGFQARSLVGGMQEATTHWCFSPSLGPSLPFSKK